MKKFILFILFLFPFYCFAQSYHINKVEYFIEGSGFSSINTTKEYALEQHVSIDTKTIFPNQEEFEEYLTKYVKDLHNTRAFETIEVTYIFDDELSNYDVFEVILTVSVKDSFHLLALPHMISYNSNEGWKPKLKAKDSNFIGSLNTMSADFYTVVPFNSDNKSYEVGAEFDFNFPFQCSIFDCEWINDYCFSYNFSNDKPEWDAQTGLKISYPFEKSKLQLELSQYSFQNFDYLIYDDSTYFKEEVKFSVPIEIFEIPEFSTFTYQPYVNFYYNWDKNGINILNTDLSSPTVSIGNKLLSDNINWYENYRKGISFTLDNENFYYFQRNEFIPFLSLDFNMYYYFDFSDSNWFSKLGTNAHIYSFCYFKNPQSTYFYGKKIGKQLRGIRDDQVSLNTSSAIIANLDLPFHIFRTNFYSNLMKYFNCDMQLSPFVDIALTKNEYSGHTFNPADGFYSGGIECLVYPKKWSSFTVRASLGFDIGRMLFPSKLNMDWRQKVSKYELFVGLGLQY